LKYSAAKVKHIFHHTFYVEANLCEKMKKEDDGMRFGGKHRIPA
jgi:hypothetical protein